MNDNSDEYIIRQPDMIVNEKLINTNHIDYETDPILRHIMIKSYNEYYSVNTNVNTQKNIHQPIPKKIQKNTHHSPPNPPKSVDKIVDQNIQKEIDNKELNDQKIDQEELIEIRYQKMRKIMEWIKNTHPRDTSKNSVDYDKLLVAMNNYIEKNNFVYQKHYDFMVSMKINPKLLTVFTNQILINPITID